MKKLLMFLILILGVGGAAAGYYLFYYKQQHEVSNQPLKVKSKQEVTSEQSPKTVADLTPDNLDYYVDAKKLGVRESAVEDAFVERYLYRGDKIHLLEKKNGWGRITAYFVYEQGGPEIAEWVPLDGLVKESPAITPEERMKTLQSYISGSDDYALFENVFLNTTDKLLKEQTCSPDDFEELGGWVKSTKYKERDVYFIYCGGLQLTDKIYLDVRSGEIFNK